MGRKKHLEDIDAYSKGYIDASMSKGITVNSEILNFNSTKLFDYKVEIKCKNKKQKDFLKALKDDNKVIIVGSGSAGAGKSWITYSYALSALKDEENEIEQIMIFVPCAQAGSKEISLGYLKGSIEDKTKPFCEASIYTMEKILRQSGNFNAKNIIDKLINQDRISFKFLNFSRGLTIDNSIIILEESENISSSEMLLLLSRIGISSKVVIIGSEDQKDRKDIKNEDSGMIAAVKNLNDLEEFAHIEFTNDDIVRNPLIGKILDRWNN